MTAVLDGASTYVEASHPVNVPLSKSRDIRDMFSAFSLRSEKKKSFLEATVSGNKSSATDLTSKAISFA